MSGLEGEREKENLSHPRPLCLVVTPPESGMPLPSAPPKFAPLPFSNRGWKVNN